MAAKVVIVAVPTVLSIASIRVYTVSEAPTDGLITREKLNIYTPLPQCAQPQFVPERPGVIQSGLTAARETILPYVQAVKGACVSVKGASVNLYHGGEDVFYYLKDPPPGFLPRLGTITMAGLLGMFLARKGSRFKRLAIPLGLMSAGASVCYPAQAVAVLKVSGKKVYAAGQWSSAAVSSLLTPKPQEPVAKEFAASQPQVNIHIELLNRFIVIVICGRSLQFLNRKYCKAVLTVCDLNHNSGSTHILVTIFPLNDFHSALFTGSKNPFCL
uniref:MICOS complex subunit n=1 Tax=Lateolabrax maculatus TaxID=315492 RepID=A0A4P8JBI6_LATMC|nr:apolipoprotein O-like protein [Lateolabrax maculatus]